MRAAVLSLVIVGKQNQYVLTNKFFSISDIGLTKLLRKYSYQKILEDIRYYFVNDLVESDEPEDGGEAVHVDLPVLAPQLLHGLRQPLVHPR